MGSISYSVGILGRSTNGRVTPAKAGVHIMDARFRGHDKVRSASHVQNVGIHTKVITRRKFPICMHHLLGAHLDAELERDQAQDIDGRAGGKDAGHSQVFGDAGCQEGSQGADQTAGQEKEGVGQAPFVAGR